MCVCVCVCVCACVYACMCVCACAHMILQHIILQILEYRRTLTQTHSKLRAKASPKWSHYTYTHVPEYTAKSNTVTGKTDGCREAREAGKLTRQADEDVGNWLAKLMKMLGSDSPSWWRGWELTRQADEEVGNWLTKLMKRLGTDSPSWWRCWRLTHQADEDVGNWLTKLMKKLGTDSPSWWRCWELTHQADEDVGGWLTKLMKMLEADSPSWWRCWRRQQRTRWHWCPGRRPGSAQRCWWPPGWPQSGTARRSLHWRTAGWTQSEKDHIPAHRYGIFPLLMDWKPSLIMHILQASHWPVKTPCRPNC